MANIKFSQFTEQTDTANVQFLVGYNGSTNVRIAPGNVSSLGGSGTLNTIAMFTPDGNTLGNSLITISNIGTTSEAVNSTPKILQVGPLTGTKTFAQINLLSGAGNSGIIDSGLGSLLLRINSSSTAALELATTGALQARSYGSGTFTGTAAYGLSVDSSGNIIETTGGAAYPFLIDTLSLYSGFVPTSLSGNPQGNTILGIDAGKILVGGNSNTLVGSQAGRFITSGGSNVVIGQNAGINVSTQSFNVVIGKEAGASGTAVASTAIGRLAGLSGNYSVSIGDQTGRFANGADNIFIGEQAGYSSQGGDGVMGIGKSASRQNTANYTISIGYNAGYTQTSGNYNTNLGFKAGYTNSTGSSNTHLGYEAGLANTASGNTSIGRKAGQANITGGYSVNIGFEAGSGQTNNNQNVNIGYAANQDANARNKTGVVAIGMSAMTNGSAGDNNIAIGKNASFNSDGSGGNNICIGYNSSYSSGTVGNEITLGNANITSFRIPGLQSSASDGDVLTFSSASGNITLQAAGGGGYPFLIDTASLYSGFVPSSLSGNPQNNTILGIDAGKLLVGGNSNTLVGSDAGRNNQNINQTTAVGDEAAFNGGGTAGTYVGLQAGRSSSSLGGAMFGAYSARNASADYHVSIGYQAGYAQTSGDGNTNIGYQAGYTNTTSGFNTAVGYQTLKTSTGADNTSLGYQAATAVTTSSRGVYIGSEVALIATTGVSDSVFIGANVQRSSAGAYNSVIIGSSAGEAAPGDSVVSIGYVAGRDNTAFGVVSIGALAGRSNTSGVYNTNLGTYAGQNNLTSGNRVCTGYMAGWQNTGGNNTFVGFEAGKGVSGSSTGGNNTTLGYQAGSSLTTGSNNTIIGYDADASSATATNEITLGNTSVTALRIPGLQSGASDGDVLTYASGTGLITLQAAGGAGYTPQVLTTSTTGQKDYLYILTGGSAITLTLPSSPSAGDSIKVSNLTTVNTCAIDPAFENLMGLGQSMTLDNNNASFELIYTNSTQGWVVIGATSST